MPWLLILTAALMVLKLTVVPALAWWMVFLPLVLGLLFSLTIVGVIAAFAWKTTK